MFAFMTRRAIAVVSLIACLLAAPDMSRAETLVGTNVDSRVILAFEVKAGALDAYAPEGWSPMAFPNGPLAGGNLLLVMIDRLVQLNPEGQPTNPPNSRYAVLAGLAAPDAGGPPRLFVYRIFASDLSANPYSNSVAAEVGRSSATTGPANGGRTRTESWAVSYDGGTLALELVFASGKAGWGPAEAFPHSAVNPDFSRIYRYDQLVDLAMSKAVGKPLDGSVSLSSTIPELSGIFDGSESLMAIMDVPVYSRQVFLP